MDTDITPEELDLVCKTFILPHRDSRDDVNYKWYVQTLENLNIESILKTLPSMYQTFTAPSSDYLGSKIVLLTLI